MVEASAYKLQKNPCTLLETHAVSRSEWDGL